MERSDKKHSVVKRVILCSFLVVLAIFIFLTLNLNKDKTSLSISAPSFAKDLPEINTTLKSYSAESDVDLLYSNKDVATISDGKINYTWQIPEDFKNRDTYVELHLEDKTKNETFVTCAYYVANNSKGLIANIFGWNKLDESQKVGCADKENKFASFTDAKREVAKTLGAVHSDNQQLTHVEVENIVNDLVKNETTVVNNYYTSGGLAYGGATGANGKDGRDGIDGKNGENSGVGSVGPAGPQGPQGETGEIGTRGERGEAGTQGEKGEKGDKGDTGDTGRDGVDGRNGNDGRDGIDGSNGADGEDGANGKSAYQSWLDLGNEGTEADFIASLKGADGKASETPDFELHVAGGGLAYDGVNLSLAPCAVGQILKVGSSGLYVCSLDNDENTTYSAGLGLTLNSNNIFSVNISDCTAEGGNKLTFNASQGGFICSADLNGGVSNIDHTLSWNSGTRTISINNSKGEVNSIGIGPDEDTTYSATTGGGLQLNGTEFGLRTCQDNQILRFEATSGLGEWICSDETQDTQDLSGYLQIANLNSAISNLSGPGYYNKTEVNNLIGSVGGGLLVPVVMENESDLPSGTELNNLPAGFQWHIENMSAPFENHTGRAWVYEDSSGNKQIYKTVDQYLSPDSTSIIKNGAGSLTISTAWLASNLNGYVDKSTLPTCSSAQFLRYNGTSFACATDKDTVTVDTDTKYTAGIGIKLNPAQNNAFAINAATCKGSANKLVFDENTGFSCEVDQVNNQLSVQSLAYNSGSGQLSISGGNTITLASYTAGNGLRLNGKEFSINLPSACADNQKLTWNGTNFQCARDNTTEPPVCRPLGFIKYETWDQLKTIEDGQEWLRLNGQELKTSDYPGISASFETGDSIITPKMTSNTDPYPYKTDQSSHWTSVGDYRGFLSFNRTSSGTHDGWASENGYVKNQWVSVALPESRTVGSYLLKSRATVEPGSAPRDFRIEGSNDGINWDILDRRTGISWANIGSEAKRFNISNPGEYTNYRLFVEERFGVTPYTMISEMELYNQDTSYKNLPVRDNNAQGLKAYIKAGGECPKDKSQVENGSTVGYTLAWDGDNWVESGALTLDTLVISDTLTIQKIRDSQGNLGTDGQVLKSGADGRVYWKN